MQDKSRNKYVYTEPNFEQGFTFIEVIVTLTIITITMPFIVYLFQYIQVQSDEDLSVYHFYIFVRNDAIRAESVSTHEDVLYFHLTTGDTAKIEQYNDVIRRQVNGTGHEIYVREIKEFKLTSLSYGTQVSLTTTDGRTYEKVIAHYE